MGSPRSTARILRAIWLTLSSRKVRAEVCVQVDVVEARPEVDLRVRGDVQVVVQRELPERVVRLDPEVVLRADASAVAASLAARAEGAPVLAPETHGARTVAKAFAGRARAAEEALIDGQPGAVFAPGGVLRVAFLFTIQGERIVGMELVADPGRLKAMVVARDAGSAAI